MTEQKVDLSNGGVAVVMIGHNGFVPEFATNPKVVFIDTKAVQNELLTDSVPDNTKAVILTEGMPEYHYTWITGFCRRKNIPFLARKSNQAIYETLKSFFPQGAPIKPTVEEVKHEISHGKLNVLVPFIDFSKSNSENAKFLLRKAQELQIKSTEASLAQLVGNQRRKQNAGTVPKSARPKLDVTVELFDQMIKDLSGMRDFLIETVDENRSLRLKLDKFRKAMED